MPTVKKYRVKTPISMGRLYEPGSTIELSDEQAAAMPWAIEPLAEEQQPPPPAKVTVVALKKFQYQGVPRERGDVLVLTIEEAEKLGPERIAGCPSEAELAAINGSRAEESLAPLSALDVATGAGLQGSPPQE